MKRLILLEPLSNMLDTTSLSSHGDVVIMFGSYGPGPSPAPSVYKTEDFEDAIYKWLAHNKYDPAADAFIVAGRTTKVALALAVIVSWSREYRPGSSIPVMIYDGQSNQYVERSLG